MISISDTLSEAAAEMRGELTAEPDSYPPGEPLTARILALIEQMDAVRQELEDRAAAELAALNQQDQPGEINDMRPPV
jgi:hypothetical protein